MGDREESRLLVHEWQARIYDFALRRIKNEADAADVTQEVLLALIRDRHQLRSAESLRSWIYKMTLNAVMNHRRRLKRERSRLETVARENHGESAGDLVMRSQDQIYLKSKVESLPADLREVIVLRYFHGLTQNHLSELLELPRGTVRSRLDKGLNQLRDALASKGAPAFGLEQSLSLLNPDPVPLHVASSLQSALIPAMGKGALALGGITVKLKMVVAGLILVFIGVAVDQTWSRNFVQDHSKETKSLQEEVALLKEGNKELKDKWKAGLKNEMERNRKLEDLASELEKARDQVAVLEKSAGELSNSQRLAAGKTVKKSSDTEFDQATKDIEKLLDEMVAIEALSKTMAESEILN